MKNFLCAAVLATLTMIPFLAHAEGASPKSLASYRNKNRVLLVFAPSAKDPAYQEQLKRWKGQEADFEDRQLVVLPVLASGDTATANSARTLAKQFDVEPLKFQVILIGKDGHDAYRSAQPVAAEELYRRIDAMPMRRDEMKAKKKA